MDNSKNNINDSRPKKNFIKGALCGLFELPEDIILNLTKISIINNSKITFENYKSIKEYSNTLINLNIKEGHIILEGQNFLIEKVTNESIAISGKLQQIKFLID